MRIVVVVTYVKSHGVRIRNAVYVVKASYDACAVAIQHKKTRYFAFVTDKFA